MGSHGRSARMQALLPCAPTKAIVPLAPPALPPLLYSSHRAQYTLLAALLAAPQSSQAPPPSWRRPRRRQRRRRQGAARAASAANPQTPACLETWRGCLRLHGGRASHRCSTMRRVRATAAASHTAAAPPSTSCGSPTGMARFRPTWWRQSGPAARACTAPCAASWAPP
jgi:hypothetical protein